MRASQHREGGIYKNLSGLSFSRMLKLGTKKRFGAGPSLAHLFPESGSPIVPVLQMKFLVCVS